MVIILKFKWPSVPLSDLIEERTDTPNLADISMGRIKVISKIDFKNGEIQLRDHGNTRTEMILVRPGDLVISGINAIKGAVAIYNSNNIEPIAATIHYSSYFPKSAKINIQYIWWLLRSQIFRSIIEEMMPGGIKFELRANRLLSVPVPLPSPTEQQIIVVQIEETVKKLKEITDYSYTLSFLIQKFRRLVLDFAFSGKLTSDWRLKNKKIESAYQFLENLKLKRKDCYYEENKKVRIAESEKSERSYNFYFEKNQIIDTWANAQLDNLIYIAGRIGWRGLKAEEYTEDGPIFLSVYNLNNGEYVNFEGAFHISKERYDESPEIQLQENDILLAKDGAGIGKIGIIKNLEQLATVNSSLLVIRARDVFIPKYLFYFLSGPRLQQIAQERISGSATPHLFQRDIKKFVLSIPPLLEQQEIVNRIELLFNKIYETEMHLLQINKLTKSLLQFILIKAFIRD